MGLMIERSCAFVQIDGSGFLCLLRADAAYPMTVPSCCLVAGTQAVDVLPGGMAEDFLWASAGPDWAVARATLPQAGVAAAVTARFYGLVLGSSHFLGRDLATPAIRLFIPPAGDWWSGEWRAGPATGPPVRYHARMVMHGEMVDRGSSFMGTVPTDPKPET